MMLISFAIQNVMKPYKVQTQTSDSNWLLSIKQALNFARKLNSQFYKKNKTLRKVLVCKAKLHQIRYQHKKQEEINFIKAAVR